ncbi:MAG: hypothetical protein QM220_02130 [Atribacterota bacterium]|jgi:hypothetical protein|nr:hypothetical protein [Atribacterota bacterium]
MWRKITCNLKILEKILKSEENKMAEILHWLTGGALILSLFFWWLLDLMNK